MNNKTLFYGNKQQDSFRHGTTGPTSLDLMNHMKLYDMAEAFKESLAGTALQAITTDIFLSMLLAREWDYRTQSAIAKFTRNVAFRYKAYLEQIDYATNWGLDRSQMERLATLDFVHRGQNLFITGSPGTRNRI